VNPKTGNILFLIPARIADNGIGGSGPALPGGQNKTKSFGKFKRAFIQIGYPRE